MRLGSPHDTCQFPCGEGSHPGQSHEPDPPGWRFVHFALQSTLFGVSAQPPSMHPWQPVQLAIFDSFSPHGGNNPPLHGYLMASHSRQVIKFVSLDPAFVS